MRAINAASALFAPANRSLTVAAPFRAVWGGRAGDSPAQVRRWQANRLPHHSRALWGACVLLLAPPAFAQSLAVLPPTVELTGPEARQQLLAEATAGDHQEDWTRDAEWSSSDPKIATVDGHGVVLPAGDGQARITARAKGRTATASVRVEGSHAPFQWSFRNHVIPVMTKMGCNSGRVPRRPGGQERIQAHPARLRSAEPITTPSPANRSAAAFPWPNPPPA